MNIKLAPIFFCVLLIASCSRPEKEPEKKRRTPKALEGKVSSVELLSKRASDDLLHALYNELADQTPALKALEDRLEKLQSEKPDSIAAFKNFNNKNEAYYALTFKYVSQVQDSSLKNELQQLLTNSLANYRDTTLEHLQLLKQMETEQKRINDLHTALKIVRTLPLIERYQKEHLPSAGSLQYMTNEYDSARTLLNSLLVMPQKPDSTR